MTTTGTTYLMESIPPMLEAIAKLKDSAIAYLHDGKPNEHNTVLDAVVRLSEDVKVLSELFKV